MESIIWIDESHVDKRSGNRSMGWSPIGKRCKLKYIFVRGKRYSVICATKSKVVICFDIIHNACDGDAFYKFMINYVLPKCIVGDTIILDNAPIHKQIEWQNMFYMCGARVLFLPAYSPELNPAEWVWQSLKQKLRKYQDFTTASPMLAVFHSMQQMKYPKFDLTEVAKDAGYIL